MKIRLTFFNWIFSFWRKLKVILSSAMLLLCYVKGNVNRWVGIDETLKKVLCSLCAFIYLVCMFLRRKFNRCLCNQESGNTVTFLCISWDYKTKRTTFNNDRFLWNIVNLDSILPSITVYSRHTCCSFSEHIKYILCFCYILSSKCLYHAKRK